MSETPPRPKPPTQAAIGDIARLRKAHPCGGREWMILRIGAEMGLECRTCGRKVSLSREEFERRCASVQTLFTTPALPQSPPE